MQRLAAKLASRRAETVLGLLSVAGLLAAAIMALAVAPPDATQGNIQRLLYVHVPSAWLAYLSFFVVFVRATQAVEDREGVLVRRRRVQVAGGRQRVLRGNRASGRQRQSRGQVRAEAPARATAQRTIASAGWPRSSTLALAIWSGVMFIG